MIKLPPSPVRDYLRFESGVTARASQRRPDKYSQLPNLFADRCSPVSRQAMALATFRRTGLDADFDRVVSDLAYAIDMDSALVGKGGEKAMQAAYICAHDVLIGLLTIGQGAKIMRVDAATYKKNWLPMRIPEIKRILLCWETEARREGLI